MKLAAPFPEELPALNKIPEYADMIPIDEWLGAVKAGSFIDYDGVGDLATKDGVSNYQIWPSMVAGGGKDRRPDGNNRPVAKFGVKIPAWVTHIAWYNK